MRFNFYPYGTIARWRRAIRYATGRWNADDASYIAYEAHQITHCWPLECVDAEGVVNLAEVLFANPTDEIRPLAEAAVARVASKWSGSGDLTGVAEDWALELVREYAAQDGIKIIEREQEAA